VGGGENVQKFVIEGGHPLKGEVSISGSKNAAVAVICGAILTDGICRIENLPKIKDVYVILDILTKLGAKITTLPDSSVIIDPTNINTYTATFDMVRKMRGSYYLLGSLLGRFSRANVSMPGGCNFGTRPIDQHIKGFVSLGADINIVHGIIEAKAEELVGNHIFLDIVSVGATINIMLAAAKAKGVTTIENAAKEPHVVDLANFLNAMGANIKGAGTDTIKITGVDHMPGGTYTIIPDQIEAGTFMIAAAAIGEDVLVKNLIPKHMESLTAKLIEVGAEITEYEDAIRVKRGVIKAVNLKTMPYPGFPTDLQPLFVTLLTKSNGTSVVQEGVWDNRFQYVDELLRMGANIRVEGKTAVIEGVPNLYGSPVRATDLRAGAGLVIAGLIANGETEIDDILHIERGYEDIDKKLQALGANIRKVDIF